MLKKSACLLCALELCLALEPLDARAEDAPKATAPEREDLPDEPGCDYQ